jgi:ankyrin repeat protein
LEKGSRYFGYGLIEPFAMMKYSKWFLVIGLIFVLGVSLPACASQVADIRPAPVVESQTAPLNANDELAIGIFRSDQSEVSAALAKGANPEEIPSISNGVTNTPLIRAIECAGPNDMSVIQKLFSDPAMATSNADPEKEPLTRAVAKDNLEVAQFLLDQGVDPNQFSIWDGLALDRAIQNGNAKMVQLLVDYGVDVNATAEPPNPKPLTSAKSKLEEIQQIIALLEANGAVEN